MTEQILALCRAMGAGREELLLPLVQAVEGLLAGRGKVGVSAAARGRGFPVAAAGVVRAGVWSRRR